MKKIILGIFTITSPLCAMSASQTFKNNLRRSISLNRVLTPSSYRQFSIIPVQESAVSHQQIALGKSRELRQLAFIQKTLVNDINSLERALRTQKQKLTSITTELHKCETEGKKSSVLAIQSAPLLSKDERRKWDRIWETEEQEWQKVHAPMTQEDRCG